MQNYTGVVREIRFVGKLVSKMAQELSLNRSSYVTHSNGCAGTSQKHGHTWEHDELLHDNQKCF